MPELDALRFFAFLAVFFAHIHLAVAPNGWEFAPLGIVSEIGGFGVDLFFALSAYLLTELLMREKERLGTVKVKAFYIRRGLRIWPLYFAFLLALFGVSRIKSVGIDIPNVYFCMFASLLCGNYVLYLAPHINYIISPLWSLALEEQFYLVWPWIMRAASRASLVLVAGVIWSVSIVCRFWFFHPGAARNLWYLSLTRLDPIACGILIATLKPCAKRRFLWAVAGVGFWVASGLLNPEGATKITLVSVAYPAIAIGAGAFLVATIGSKNRVLRHAALIYLGKISYGLYVLHAAMLWLIVRVVGSPCSIGGMVIIPALALILTAGAAAASYRWLESPFLRLKRRFEIVPST